MIARDILPSGPLKAYIGKYRLRHVVFTDNSYLSCKPFPPRPEQSVVFYPRGAEQSYWLRLKNPALDWLSIAIACGYNDYQHLVKDYKEFANTTPNLFFNEERQAPGRVLGLSK